MYNWVNVVCVGKSAVGAETSAAGWRFYLGVFGQQVSVGVVDAAQLLQHLILMLLPHKVLGVDPVAQVSS